MKDKKGKDTLKIKNVKHILKTLAEIYQIINHYVLKM